ncbi:MAG: V-type ATP synthase subunit I [Bacteroides sp.]
MITRMEKLTFLIYHKAYETFLDQIRELGVVHIVEKQRGEPDAGLQQAFLKRSQYKSMLQKMDALAEKQHDAHIYNKEKDSEALVKEYEALQNRIMELQQQIPAISKEIDQMEVWGEFDWARLKQLEQAGWLIRFYNCSEKDFREEWADQVVVVRRESGHIYFVSVSHELMDLGLEPLRLPASSLSQLVQKLEDAKQALTDVQVTLKQFCQKYYNTLAEASVRLQNDIDLMQVRLSSEALAEGAVVLLEGWVPEDAVDPVKQLLEAQEVYYEMRPACREDNPPVKLRNNAFTRMYEVLTKMYGMPSFTDFDPTPIVAPFFSLFFAFCMGDAGYGLALIALGFFLKKKLGKDMAGMMNLVITLGIFTTVFGAVLGTFFGMNLLQSDLPQQIKQFIIAGNVELFGSTYDKQMILALGIGVVHISIAMTVKAINSTVFYGFKESLSAWGWWLLIVGSVVVGTLSFLSVIPAEVSKWAFIGVGGVAAIGIYLLNNLHRSVLVNVGAGLWDTYNMASGLLGDILSYVRLFALGLAGAMLGQTFNSLALMVVDGQEGIGLVFGWIGFGLIILVGHTLNIAMSCLSAFVHPLRLTFVEYFKNAGYDGKGVEYKPFKK